MYRVFGNMDGSHIVAKFDNIASSVFFLIFRIVVKSRVGERGCNLVDLKTEIKVQDIVNNSHEGLIFSTFYLEIFASFCLRKNCH